MEGRPGGDWLEIKREIKRGAEAVIYEGIIKGFKVVVKKRLTKPYRHPELDRRINEERTKSEARLMYQALKAGVNVPGIFLVLPHEYTIIMEFVEGTLVKDLERLDRELGIKIGEAAGKLHASGITHGDLTTGNMILNPTGELFLIDFGLAKRTDDIEDQATDVHVFMRSLESVHPQFKEVVMEGFMEGYSRYVKDYEEVLRKVKEIRMRGRYVEERRAKGSNV